MPSEPPPLPGAPGLPDIPSYDEAIASSSRSEIEAADAAGLLRSTTPNPPTNPNLRNGNYRPPRADSVRSSMSSDFLTSPSTTPRHSREDLRREMEILEIEDPLHPNSQPTSSKSLQRTSILAKTILRRLSALGSRLKHTYLAFTPFHGLRHRLSTSCPNPLNLIPEQFTNGTYTPLYRLLGIITVMIVIYILMASEVFTMRRPMPKTEYTRSTIREYVLSELRNDADRFRKFERHVASFDHLAGTKGDYALVEWVHGWFNTFRMDTLNVERFDVYLTFATPDGGGRKVEVVSPGKMKWRAELEETVEGRKGGAYAFHAFAGAGDVTGHLVYAGTGTKAEFEVLEKDEKVELKGAVVLVRREREGRDLSWIIKEAAERGAVGVLTYKNPVTPEVVDEWNGIGIPDLSDYVMRESAGGLVTPGDVATPGVPADKEAVRLDPSKSPELPKIPSMPISFKSAQHLIKLLENQGTLQKVDSPWPQQYKDSWFYEDYTRWTGSNSTSAPHIHLESILKTKTQPIWNVITTIEGIESPEKKIIIGAPRSSFCHGATTSASGTSILLEIAHVFGTMYNLGWRPLRSIQFISFDASEMGSIGAIEHVESHTLSLLKDGYAFLNLGPAISGPTFHASGHPALHSMLRTILQLIPDPSSHKPIYQTWPARDLTSFPMLAGAGDYLPFQSHVGVFTLDLSFRGGVDLAGSCHDTTDFLEKHTEHKDFRYHRTLAEITSLLILELADTQQATFSLMDYAVYMATQFSALDQYIHSLSSYNHKLNLAPLRDAIEVLGEQTRVFETTPRTWQGNGENFEYEDQSDRAHRISHNGRMANLETHLLDLVGGEKGKGGVRGREWFRHVFVAPDKENRNVPVFFPHIREAVDRGEDAQPMVELVAGVIKKAAVKLNN